LVSSASRTIQKEARVAVLLKGGAGNFSTFPHLRDSIKKQFILILVATNPIHPTEF
jgi:hypothetical protein